MYQLSHCSPKGVDTRWYANKDAGLKRGGFGAVPHRLEEGKSASEDAGLRRESPKRTISASGGFGSYFLVKFCRGIFINLG